MVLLNMYGKIEPTTISEKLGVGICNPTSDWVEGFLDDFTEEILVFNHNVATYKRDGYDVSWADGRFDLDQIVERFGWHEDGKKATQIIAEHLIEIQVSDFDNSLLQIKNPYIDSPTCEPQYTRKFLNFSCRVQSSKSSQKIIPNQIPFSTYNSDDWNTKPLILNHVAASLHMEYKDGFSNQVYTDGGIASLKYIGKLIDSFLVTEKDFWLLDYIINAVFSDSDYNAYHVFKTMSLIEMLIIDSKENGKTIGAMEKKLPQFLSDRIPREKAFAPNKTPYDWLCSDEAELHTYLNDHLCCRNISAGLFWQLLDAMKRTGNVHTYRYWHRETPVLLLSGAKDPVGDFGKGVQRVMRSMAKGGMINVRMNLIPNARHDLLHEKRSGAAYEAIEVLTDWLFEKI